MMGKWLPLSSILKSKRKKKSVFIQSLFSAAKQAAKELSQQAAAACFGRSGHGDISPDRQ